MIITVLYMPIKNLNEQKITKDEIQHIADLARIEIGEEEKEKYASEISVILGYIAQLNEVDVGNIKPTAQVSGIINAVREDRLSNKNAEERERILDCVPVRERNYIKVKSVLRPF